MGTLTPLFLALTIPFAVLVIKLTNREMRRKFGEKNVYQDQLWFVQNVQVALNICPACGEHLQRWSGVRKSCLGCKRSFWSDGRKEERQ